jgi:hypothetical protein
MNEFRHKTAKPGSGYCVPKGTGNAEDMKKLREHGRRNGMDLSYFGKRKRKGEGK